MTEHDPFVEHQKELKRQWQEQERIFAVCNASLRASLREHCPLKTSAQSLETCLTCGDSECFDAFKAQNKLWGISDEQSLRELRFMQNARPKTLFVSPKAETDPDNDDKDLFDLAA